PERRPEPVDVKSDAQRAGDGARQLKHEAVDDQQEEAEGEQDQWDGEDLRQKTHDRVDHAENEREAEEREPATLVGDPRHHASGHPERGGVDEKSYEEARSHGGVRRTDLEIIVLLEPALQDRIIRAA